MPAASHHSLQTKVPWWIPLIAALVCMGLGILSGVASGSGLQEWYRELAKPPGNPPSWVFGPVWTALYLMMGIAAGRMYARGAWLALGYFTLSFILNLGWSPTFFLGHWLLASVAIIVAMWLLILLTIRSVWNTDHLSAWLLVPYLAWVSYAAYLNIAIAFLNL